MTALLAIVALDGATVHRDVLDSGVRALGGFAPFGADVDSAPDSCVWAARARSGSMLARCGDRLIAIDGRLRDRASYFREHALPPTDSDAEALLRAYMQSGIGVFEALDADLACVLIDRSQRRIVLYRDRLGERGLRFHCDSQRVYVSTRASAICALRGRSAVGDEVAIAHFFATRAPPDTTSWLQGVRELPAGACWRIEDGQLRASAVKACALPEPLRFRNDADAIGAWRETLAAAVGRQCAGAAQPAVMLSGGIDSTLLVAVEQSPRPIALSWALSEWPECNEAPLAEATASALGLRHECIADDGRAPLADLEHWLVEDDAPIANPYRWLQQALFQRANACGVDVLLSGNFGDHIYADSSGWPASLVAERGFTAFAAEVGRGWRRWGLRGLWQDAGLRSWLRPRRSEAGLIPSWLTPEAGRMLDDRTDFEPGSHRIQQAFGRASAQDAELGRRFACAFGLEVRFPYRDPALLQFMLALPAHYSEAMRDPKWISREVLPVRIPQHIRERPKSGNLAPYFRDSVMRVQREAVVNLLSDPEARWPRFVRRTLVQQAFEQPQSDAELLPVWLAISHELWWRAHDGRGPGVLASGSMSRALSQP